jgi:hypothetical protein
MKQGRSLVELAQELSRRVTAKSDFVADTRSLSLSADATTLAAEDSAYPITPLVHRQIGAWANVPAKYYDRMQAEAPELLSRNINHWLTAAKDVRRMIRTLDGNARAFLSDRYRRIDNEQVAEAVLPLLLGAGPDIRVESCEVTESKLYLKAVFPRIEGEVKRGDAVQSGIVISNSEVGLGSLSVQPLIFRLVCTNGMVLPDSGLSRYHVGGKVGDGANIEALLRDETKAADDRALMLKLTDVVRASLDQVQFNSHLARMRVATEGETVARPVQAVEQLSKAFTFSSGEQDSILNNLIRGQDFSRWGMLNAVTAVANDHPSYDRATELEEIGGRILNLAANDWRVVAEAA